VEKRLDHRVNETIGRVSFEALELSLAHVLEPRYRRLGYLGEFFRCMAHQPHALKAFIEFTELAKAPLEKRVTEVIALTLAVASGNSYELNQHERLAIRGGFSRDWIRDVELLDPDQASHLSALDRMIQRWVLAIDKRDFDEAGRRFDFVVAWLGVDKGIAALMVVGRYAAHAVMVKTLGLTPPVPSIFQDGFTGD
jgi:hypothetical protein